MKHGHAKSSAEIDYYYQYLLVSAIYIFVHAGIPTKLSILFLFIIKAILIDIQAQSGLPYSNKLIVTC